MWRSGVVERWRWWYSGRVGGGGAGSGNGDALMEVAVVEESNWWQWEVVVMELVKVVVHYGWSLQDYSIGLTED